MDPILSNLAAYPGEFKQELMKQMYNALKLEQDGVLVMIGVKYKMTLTKLFVGDGAKPGTGVFVAKDDVNYVPRTIEVEKGQRDLEINPDKYRQTFMAKARGKSEGANNQTIPFAEFTWNAVLEALGTEINLQTVYFGVGKAAFAAFNGGSVYTAGDLITFTQSNEVRYFRCLATTTAGQSPDTTPAKWAWSGARAIAIGFGKRIADGITAAELVPVATGVITASNAYDKQISVFRAMPEPVKLGTMGKVYMYQSMTDYEALVDDYENKISKNFETIDGVTYLAKTKQVCIVKPVSWLSGSRRLICTLDGNLVAATDDLNDMNDIRSTPQMYTVNAAITFVIGFNYQDAEVMRVNDQA